MTIKYMKEIVSLWNQGNCTDGSMLDRLLEDKQFKLMFPQLRNLIIDLDGDLLSDYEACQILAEVIEQVSDDD